MSRTCRLDTSQTSLRHTFAGAILCVTDRRVPKANQISTMKGVQRLHRPTCSVPQRTKSRAATTARPIGSLGTPGANSCRGTPDFLRTKVNVMRPSDANIAVKARSTRTPLLHVRCVASAGGDAVVSAPPRGVTYRNLGGNSWKMHMPQSNTTVSGLLTHASAH